MNSVNRKVDSAPCFILSAKTYMKKDTNTKDMLKNGFSVERDEREISKFMVIKI